MDALVCVCETRTLDLGKATSTLYHHLVSSGHVPLTKVTRSGAVMAIECGWLVMASAVLTSSTFVISIMACGIVSGCGEHNKKKIKEKG